MGINTGALYIIFILLALIGFAYLATGPTIQQTPVETGPLAVVNESANTQAHANLQLYQFPGATITPPVTNLCKKGGINIHPEALVAVEPQEATGVSNTGQISLWVSDNKAPVVAPGQLAVRSSGAIKVPGDIEAPAPDGYLMEPQLYILPAGLEKNGKAYFPNDVKGEYNNGLPQDSFNTDLIPNYALPTSTYTVEFVWNVASIGLTDGIYNIEFVAHDGNEKLGIICTTLYVYTPPAAENSTNQLPL